MNKKTDLFVEVKSYDGKKDYFINQKSNLDFKNETYSASLGYNPEFNTDDVRINFSSLTTPSTVLNFNIESEKEEVVKQQDVLGGKFKSSNYTSERIFADAHDGKNAISIVRHVDTQLNSEHLYYYTDMVHME